MGARPTNRTIIGGGLLLFGLPLAIVGLGHLISNGSCSTTGFDTDSGAPLPFCPRGEGFWFLFLFGGICVTVAAVLVLALGRRRGVAPVPPVSPLVPPPPAPDVVAQLDRLTALHAQGALTDAELAAAKARLLM
jgi:uncharacterized membrane protein YedE/YeeE